MRYRVNTTCQFRNRLYEKGEVIDLPAEVETPPYFDALEDPAPSVQDASHMMYEEYKAVNTTPVDETLPTSNTPHEEEMPVTDVPTTGKRGRKK